jgi:two-component system, chemotaxis family, CheB/CheR fusion protein
MSSFPLQILLIEDDRATNDTLARLLRKAGHDVSAAKNGTVAGEMLALQRFDLIISDIGLPDTNGWDLIQRLRKQQPDLRAIALTGYGYPNDMKRSTQVGFEMHLTKPVEWPMIKAALASLFPHLSSNRPPAADA